MRIGWKELITGWRRSIISKPVADVRLTGVMHPIKRCEPVADDLTKISRFCAAMGLDCGRLDILRANESQKTFIVDVNKINMGPSLALPLAHKLRSTRIMGAELAGFIQRQPTKASGLVPRLKEQS